MNTDELEPRPSGRRPEHRAKLFALGIAATAIGAGIGFIAREWFLSLLMICWVALLTAFFSARPVARSVCAGGAAGLMMAMAMAYLRVGR